MRESEYLDMALGMRKLQLRHGKSKFNEILKEDTGERCHETDPPAHAALHSESWSVDATQCDSLQLGSGSTFEKELSASDVPVHECRTTVHAINARVESDNNGNGSRRRRGTGTLGILSTPS
jgi:hypothetical protein